MKQIMYHEEKIKGIIPEGTVAFARGKVNWWNETNIGKDAPPEYVCLFCEKLDVSKLEGLKDVLKKKLSGEGFIFFEETYYRYTLNKGKLEEFGINFHHLK